MKKALLISNIETKFSNFIVPPAQVLTNLGYEVHACANISNFKENKEKYNYIKMHHIDFERNPLNLKNIRAYKQLLKLMEEEEFDLVHCNTPIGGVLGRICAKKLSISKVIYTAHGFHFYKGAPVINNVIYKNVERFLARYTDILVTINKEDYEAAKKFKLRKNGQVYLVHGVGINSSIFQINDFDRLKYRKKFGINLNNIVLIAIGELNKNKNFDIIIKAISLVRDKNIHLLICGTGKEKERLVKLVKKYNLIDNIHFLGFRSDIPQLLLSSDILVQASYREGLPRSIMEAMAVGLPCVVSNIRGNSDLIKDNKGGFLNRVDSPKEFAKSIFVLINNPSLRNRMGEFNKQFVKQFDTTNVKNKLLEIYNIFENKED